MENIEREYVIVCNEVIICLLSSWLPVGYRHLNGRVENVEIKTKITI